MSNTFDAWEEVNNSNFGGGNTPWDKRALATQTGQSVPEKTFWLTPQIIYDSISDNHIHLIITLN